MNIIEKWAKIICPVVTMILIIFLYEKLSNIKAISVIIITLRPFVFSFLIAWILNPVVVYLSSRFKIPRWIAAIIVLVMVLIILASIVILIIPEMINQVKELIKFIPSVTPIFNKSLYNVQNFFGIKIDLTLLQKFNIEIESILKNIFSNGLIIINGSIDIIGNFIKSIFILLMITMVSIYLLIDFQKFTSQINSLVPKRMKSDFKFISTELNLVIVGYLRGLIIETILVGLLAYLAFLIAGIDGALVFAFIIGVTNIIPYIGPFIGAVPVCIYAFSERFDLFIVVLIIVIVVQQIDSILIKPKVFGQTTDVHPAFCIMSIVVFGKLFGVTGIIFAIPVAGMVIVLTKFIYKKLVKNYPHIMR